MTSTGEFEILGHRVKFRPKGPGNVDPLRAVDLLLNEVAKIKSQSETHTNEAILLAALKFASDRIVLEEEVGKNINHLQSSAMDALQLIEEVAPAQN